MVAPSSLPLCTPNPCSAIHTQAYTVYSRGMESGPSGFDPLSLCPSFPSPPSLPRPFYRPFRVLRDARPSPHPLKEDDRLEDTQAPANGFVLLASIGIKPPSPAVRFAATTRTTTTVLERGKISGRHGYVNVLRGRKEININAFFETKIGRGRRRGYCVCWKIVGWLSTRGS